MQVGQKIKIHAPIEEVNGQEYYALLHKIGETEYRAELYLGKQLLGTPVRIRGKEPKVIENVLREIMKFYYTKLPSRIGEIRAKQTEEKPDEQKEEQEE